VDICCNVRLAYSSLCTMCDNAGRTEESTWSGTKVTSRRISFLRSSKMEHMAEIFSIWIEDQKQCHMPGSAFG